MIKTIFFLVCRSLYWCQHRTGNPALTGNHDAPAVECERVYLLTDDGLGCEMALCLLGNVRIGLFSICEYNSAEVSLSAGYLWCAVVAFWLRPKVKLSKTSLLPSEVTRNCKDIY